MEARTFSCFLLMTILGNVFAEVTISLNYDKEHKDIQLKLYDIRGTTELRCNVKATSGEKFTIQWTDVKNEKHPEERNFAPDERRTLTKGESHAYISMTKSTEDDAGTYSCIVKGSGGEELAREKITLYNKYRIKSPANVNVIEGEKLTLHCSIIGKPAVTVVWTFGNTTFNESNERVVLKADENGNANAIFMIKEASMDDRGEYRCEVEPDYAPPVAHITMLRVKDKYAALWPFLGICAEVFILCAIILIYEKKRNKTELEESDTDQSPDQKNTPDHGKEANLRHRN